MIEDPNDGEPVTPYMDVYKAKIQSDGSRDKLKLRIVVRGDRNDTESDDESDSESIMMSEQDMENLDETEKFDDDLISTETLHDIRDGNQTHPSIDKREASLAICDRIKQKKSQWKGSLRATHNMGKVLHRVFSTIVSEISQELTNFGESGSEISHFIPEPRNFSEVTKLVNSCEISDTIVLKTLCKPFPILCVALNAPSHCVFLISVTNVM